jgi:hypothetical protein
MKKIVILVIAAFVFTGSAIYYNHAHAQTYEIIAGSNGPGCNDGGYFTPSTKNINAGESITFKVPSNDPYPGGLEIHNFPGGNITVQRGESRTTPALLVDVAFDATWPSNPSCKKGSGSITVIQQQAPAAAPASPLPTPPPPPAPPVVPPPTPVKPPETLKLDKVTTDGDKLDNTKPISLDRTKPLTISGYTFANGVINLTIHSTLRSEIARANDEGFWSFTIENLEPGNHTVDATVTDLVTHLTSESATLLKFAVTDGSSSSNKSDNAQAAQVSSNRTKNKIPVVAVIAFLFIITGAGILWFIMKNKKPSEPKTPAQPPVQIQPSL